MYPAKKVRRMSFEKTLNWASRAVLIAIGVMMAVAGMGFGSPRLPLLLGVAMIVTGVAIVWLACRKPVRSAPAATLHPHGRIHGFAERPIGWNPPADVPSSGGMRMPEPENRHLGMRFHDSRKG